MARLRDLKVDAGHNLSVGPGETGPGAVSGLLFICVRTSY